MFWPFGITSHQRDWYVSFLDVLWYIEKKNLLEDSRFKQNERDERIQQLTRYHESLSLDEENILEQPIDELVQGVQNNTLEPFDILRAYGKVALRSHAKTNCLTEVMVRSAEEWLEDGTIDMRGPLAGIPVSLKDTIIVKDFDATVGFSSFIGNKSAEDGPMVQILKQAGAVPYVKTNVPITLLSFESNNDVWGRSTNPYNSLYTPGGSTGGESALLAMGGRVGIGSDVAGSLRVPAHFSGCFALRCSTGRWPKAGTQTSMPGQEGVPAVYSPMARTLEDLTYFTRAIIQMEPWKFDHTVHPLPWDSQKADEYLGKARLRVGVVDPSPACSRAVDMVSTALGKMGHDVVQVTPPSCLEALRVASLALNADGCQAFSSFLREGEQIDPGAAQLKHVMDLPWPLHFIYYTWVKYFRRDQVWATLISGWRPQTAYQNWKLVSQREAIRKEWFNWWDEQGIDFLITPPNATPAVPHGAMKDAVSSCGYTLLFNLVR